MSWKEMAYKLAMYVLQSDIYAKRVDIEEAVDDILAQYFYEEKHK